MRACQRDERDVRRLAHLGETKNMYPVVPESP